MIFLKVLAMIIVFGLAYSSFDPKYRYNEHKVWNPGFPEHITIGLIIAIIWAAIIF